MSIPLKPAPLEYETPPPPLHPKWMTAGITGAASGLMLVSVLVSMVTSGGPVFPLTLAIPHAWIIVECASVRWQMPAMFAGGALTGAVYAALPFLPHRRWTIPAAVMIHVACFVAVCWIRDVWSLL